VQMKRTQADTPTIRMDCHPIQTYCCPHLCHPTIFTPDALPGTTLPFYPAWNRHQVCWLPYPVASFIKYAFSAASIIPLGRVVSAKKFAGLKHNCCHQKCTHKFGFTFLILHFWCRLTRVVPDKIQEGHKMVVCARVKQNKFSQMFGTSAIMMHKISSLLDVLNSAI